MPLTRREYLSALGLAAAASTLLADDTTSPSNSSERMQWWHDARFGMFVHFGLYSALSRHEWAMEEEGIPVAEYEKLAKKFNPEPNAARAWAKLAKKAGMRYIVMTTKHHEGFCLFNTATTDYCAPKQGPGRDLVKEYVDAARAEGLRVGFYFSLMDWHHPDGAKCATDPDARARFVPYVHAQIRELLSNYGKIDVLWYDVAWPLDAAGWESDAMNKMVFELQPNIVVNNRNKLAGDFQTPEQHITASDKAWEACMTMNDSWGFQKSDDNWKSPKTIVRNLVSCARDGGNYLLNIGPKPDGSIPEDSVRILSAVGKWMDTNSSTIYTAERCKVNRSQFANFTRKGNTLYIHAHFWPGETLSIGGIQNKVVSATLLKTGAKVAFDQDGIRTRFSGLPVHAPDEPVSVLAVELDSEPEQIGDFVRTHRPRLGVNVS